MIDDQYLTYRTSSWDNSIQPIITEPTRMSQNAPPLSLSPNNQVVPWSRYNPQSVNRFNSAPPINQPVTIQTKGLETAQAAQSSNNNSTSGNNHGAFRITPFQVIGLLSGIILAGIPLAVITVLFVQLNTSSSSSNNNNNGGANSVATTSMPAATLPNQCSSYGTINDGTRIVSSSACCYSDCSSFSGWYRITGASGSQLVTYPVSSNGGWCGTNYPGWFNGSLPSGAGKTTLGTFCVNGFGNLCHPSYSINNIIVTNCSGFYVFYLYPVGCCCNYPRYCTI